MAKIKQVLAEEILDSRGNPTIETTIILSDGVWAKSSVPNGATEGVYEASQLRDGDTKRFGGLGVKNAVLNVQTIIAPKIVGMDCTDQQKIDKLMIELDGTQNKGRLGANAILSVSQAVAKAGAKSSLLPLSVYIRQFLGLNDKPAKIPTPMFNIIEGGKHAQGSINFQEFLLVPASAKTYSESLEIASAVYSSLRTLLRDRNLSTLNADEGGFSPVTSSNIEALNLLKQAIDQSGYKFSFDVFLGVDAAAHFFLDGKEYRLLDRPTPYNQDDLVEYYTNIFNEYSLIYIEDPFAEDDWEGWKKIYNALSSKTLIIGDDITTTNPYRLQLALDNNVINGMVIKPNQAGTVTETLAVVEMAKFKNLKIVVSQRSGETMDDFIADFAVGVGADYVKFGAPVHERVLKYNRLTEIEAELKQI